MFSKATISPAGTLSTSSSSSLAPNWLLRIYDKMESRMVALSSAVYSGCKIAENATRPRIARSYLKKLSEVSPDTANLLLREDERLTRRRQRESARLGGLVTVATGVGLALFLWGIVPERRVFLLGAIPLLVGLALLVYARWSAPRE
jgi:hypothetical protein